MYETKKRSDRQIYIKCDRGLLKILAFIGASDMRVDCGLAIGMFDMREGAHIVLSQL